MVQLSSLPNFEPFVDTFEPDRSVELAATRNLASHASTASVRMNGSLLLSDKEAAPLLGVAPATLRSWRGRGIGPAYVKFDGLRGGVRYDVRDIAEYRERCRHTPSVRAAFEGK
jgi:Helix-turn-helix domain